MEFHRLDLELGTLKNGGKRGYKQTWKRWNLHRTLLIPFWMLGTNLSLLISSPLVVVAAKLFIPRYNNSKQFLHIDTHIHNSSIRYLCPYVCMFVCLWLIDLLVSVFLWSNSGYGVCMWQISQFAEMNPEVLFLQVNYEEHKSMCYSLGVHVLPFFRFYRGAHGRLCSFSCTNATVNFHELLTLHMIFFFHELKPWEYMKHVFMWKSPFTLFVLQLLVSCFSSSICLL